MVFFLLCKCCLECCYNCCCNICSSIKYCFTQVFCTTVGLLCFVFGLILTAILIGLYYFVYLPSLKPSISVQHTVMYDYTNHPYHDVKRDVNYVNDRDVSGENSKGKHHDILDQYYNYMLDTEQEDHDVDDYVSLFFNKRDVPLSTNNASATSVPRTSPGQNSGGAATGNSTVTSSGTTTPGSQRIEETVEPLPDFHLSNSLINTVFDKSEVENWTMSLGLCRKNSQIKIPSFNTTSIRVESSADIQNCINNILKSVTTNKLCYQLDPEMLAYLKWLVLSGEPRWKQRKPASLEMSNGFLFASNSCEVIGQGGGIVVSEEVGM